MKIILYGGIIYMMSLLKAQEIVVDMSDSFSLEPKFNTAKSNDDDNKKKSSEIV